MRTNPNNAKKTIAALVCVCMLSMGLPSMAFADSEDVEFFPTESTTVDAADTLITSGQCGLDASYALYGDGTLYITGSGDMWDWTSLSHSPFEEMDDASALVIEDGITSIGNYAFSYSALKSVTIADSVTDIGDAAFYCCTRLNQIEIPSSVVSIGSETFYWCKSLTSVVIPGSVKSLGSEAFSGCSRLITAKVGNGVTAIKKATFSKCTLLSTITLGNGIKEIGSEAFYECVNLLTISIPSKVTTIGSNAFKECINLNNISLPKSLTLVKGSAFSGCKGLTDVYYAGTKSKWASVTIKSGNSYLTKAKVHCSNGIASNTATTKQTIKLAKQKITVKRGSEVAVNVKGAKSTLAYSLNKKAKKALKIKVQSTKKIAAKAKSHAKKGTYQVKVYAKKAGSYKKSNVVRLKVKVR